MAPTKKKTSSSNKKKKQGVIKVDLVEDELPRGGEELFPVMISGLVLIIALIVRFWVNSEGSSVISPVSDPLVYSFLTTFVCNAPGGYCHDSLEPTRRTQRATEDIEAGERVLSVPRELQIWDLDALRDPFISNKIPKTVRHENTGHPIDSGAFLAVYLVRRHRMAKNQRNETDHVDPMLPYLDILPSWDDLVPTHPTLWPVKQDIVDKFGYLSNAFNTIQAYRDMMMHEYYAFANAFEKESEFTSQVSEREYYAMRVNVLSRSFGTGPPGPEQGQNYKNKNGISIEEELELLKTERGIDLSLGCKAMVPMLDMYDHHATPNVEWRFEPQSNSFVIHSGPDGIQAGYEVMDSYGTFTDTHLIAKFGFVNGDGSDYTEASLALHTLYDPGLKQQFSYIPLSGPSSRMEHALLRTLLDYLLYDDGYLDCIQESTSDLDAMKLKHLKLQHLVKIANKRDRWIITLPPRVPDNKPGKSTAYPIVNAGPPIGNLNVSLDIAKQLATCRLMTLHESDFDGRAVSILREVLDNDTAEDFFIDKLNTAHEYRSYKCLQRLSMLGGERFQSRNQATELAYLLMNENLYQTDYSAWTAAQVRLGEIQTLLAFEESCNKIAMNILSDVPEKDRETEAFFIRDVKCPEEYSLFLL